MISQPILDLIAKAANKHNLPVELVTAIVKVESGGNPWAVRFEPAFYDKYVSSIPKLYGAITRETERKLLATSFGLMQIMGQTARTQGYDGAFLTELCDPEIGLEWGCRYLENQRDRYEASYGINGVIASYNAGSVRLVNGKFRNQDYVDKVLSWMKK